MKNNFKLYVQKVGKFMSGMVMPNIGAFIAWGLITALFIDVGWLPNATLSAMVGPMIVYMLPLLIAFTAGKMVHGTRGSVIAVIATMGVIVGAEVPMFLGAMIVGPLSALLLKVIDDALEGNIKPGFEMLINNFTMGILGMFIAIGGVYIVGPVMTGFSDFMGGAVELFVDAGLLPLASIFIEPAKILFLNNAINHGVLTPLGILDAAEHGKSIFFMLETNPGPGLGVLLAFWVFGKGMVKSTAPGAVIIHFFGGIHEIYFPYILMKPALILAVIAGGATGVFLFDIFDVGLVASPAPGSIFAVMAMTPKGNFAGVLAGVGASTAVSFFVSSIILKRDKSEGSDLVAAQEKMLDLKGNKAVDKIAFACDAGMGSSAMGASTLRNKFKNAGIDITVVHCSVDAIPSDAKLVVTHENLADRVRKSAPGLDIVTITNFIGAPEYDQLVEKFRK